MKSQYLHRILPYTRLKWMFIVKCIIFYQKCSIRGGNTERPYVHEKVRDLYSRKATEKCIKLESRNSSILRHCSKPQRWMLEQIKTLKGEKCYFWSSQDHGWHRSSSAANNGVISPLRMVSLACQNPSPTQKTRGEQREINRTSLSGTLGWWK